MVCDSSPFLVPAMANPCLLGCVLWRAAQELVGMSGKGVVGLYSSTLVRRADCPAEGGRRHFQPCEQVLGLSFLSVAQPERCQIGLVGGRLGWRTEIPRLCASSCSVPRPVSLCVGFCTGGVHSTRRRRRPESGWRCGGSSLWLHMCLM